MASDTTLVIKNPSRNNHFSISFRLDDTIADLQKVLSETYEGHPAPADQTLIYGGKVLKDSSVRLRDIVSKHDAPEGPHSIHLVVKAKPATSLASPARSVDSSAAVSRASSTVNAASGFAGVPRPVPPPTRTVPAGAGAANPGAGPSSSNTPRASRTQVADPLPTASTSASQGESDELEAAARSFLNSWAAFPGTPGGLYGSAVGGYPFTRPAAPGVAASDPTAATAAGPGGSAATAATAATPPPAALMPYMYYNPIIGGAYQAAYSAALAALSVASPQQLVTPEQPGHQELGKAAAGPSGEQGGTADGEAAAERAAPAAGTAAALETAATAAPGLPQYAYVPLFVPAYGQMGYPYGVPRPYAVPQMAGAAARRSPSGWAWPPNPLAQPQPWQLPIPPAGSVDPGLGMLDLSAILEALEGGPAGGPAGRRPGGRGQEAAANHGAAGGPAAREGPQLGIRLRRGQVLVLGANGPVAGNDQLGARNRAAPWRPRVFTIRISARALLQALVFAIVLYQHFTWHRFLALLFGAAVMFITSTWAPFRRLMRGIHGMPGPAFPGQAPAGAGAQGDGGAAAGPAAGAGAQGAAGAGQQGAAPQQREQQQRRGFLHEILVFVVGFITSLLPAWNFNPDDAAAFAAGQDMVAAEERMRQQQQQQQQGAEAAPADREAPLGGGAEAGGAGPAQGAGEAPEGAPAAADAAAAPN